MLQRIQTLYLLLVVFASGGLIFWVPLYADVNQSGVMVLDKILFLLLFLGSALLALIAIFMYKNRQLQFVLNRLNILLNFILLGVLVYQSQILSGGAAAPEKGIGMIIPLLSIVLLALANKAIKRDEDLVKSVDRLR
ncbi:DUF4293 family protein [Croceiramulus getboli]|nr:DUF4293 family protein [Flavobacteriaceae bacterium YJPT1-3]